MSRDHDVDFITGSGSHSVALEGFNDNSRLKDLADQSNRARQIALAQSKSRTSNDRIPNQLDLDSFSSARPPRPSKIETFDHDEDDNIDEIDAIKAACLGRGGLCGCCWCCARHHPCARFCCSPQCQTIGFLIFLLALIVAFIYIVLATGDDRRPAQSVLLDVQEIMQWNANFGYCGEASLVQVSLYFGQYISQFDARAIASPGVSQHMSESQLLLGDCQDVNAQAAARRLKLDTSLYCTSNTGSSQNSTIGFMAWIKQSILAGHPVIIGVFYNRRLDHVNVSAALQKPSGSIGHASLPPLGLHVFNESEGDVDYDHIVTVTGIDLADGGAGFHARDTMRFADHEGLSDRMIFEELPRNRIGANRADRIYSLNTLSNWGLQVKGIVDTDHSALPVRLRILSSSAHAHHTHDDDEYGPLIPSGAFYDFPDMHVGGRERPALPRSVQLRVEVSVRGLRPGDRFILCRFLRADAVPTSAFAACAGKADTWWTVSASSPASETVASAPQSDALVLPTGTGVISRDFSAPVDSSAHGSSVWVQWKRTDVIFASDTVFYRAALLSATAAPSQ